MTEVHFTNLLIVVAVALAAPLVLGFFPRLRLPAIVLEIVLEIVLGIVIGPSGLGWVTPDLPISILALIGLALLLFLAGLEIDVERLRGQILWLTARGFAASFAIAVVLGFGLKAGGFVKSPLFVAIVLVSTSLGVIVPVLKDSVCNGGYETNLALADLTGGKAWIAFSYDGRPLAPEHGGPACLLVPHLYFWKSAKWVRALILSETDKPGFWETNGYHRRGDRWREQRYCGD